MDSRSPSADCDREGRTSPTWGTHTVQVNAKEAFWRGKRNGHRAEFIKNAGKHGGGVRLLHLGTKEIRNTGLVLSATEVNKGIFMIILQFGSHTCCHSKPCWWTLKVTVVVLGPTHRTLSVSLPVLTTAKGSGRLQSQKCSSLLVAIKRSWAVGWKAREAMATLLSVNQLSLPPCIGTHSLLIKQKQRASKMFFTSGQCRSLN